jgi:conjugal transfer pilus assembly protein TraK
MFSFGVLIFQQSAVADDFLNVADGQKVHITIAKRDMSRLSLVNDRIKSIVIADNPIEYKHDPSSGDILFRPNSFYNKKFVNFFIKSKKGFTYQIFATIKDVPGTQIFLSNPLSIRKKSKPKTNQKDHEAISLVKLMWNGTLNENYTVDWKRKKLNTSFTGLNSVIESSYVGSAMNGIRIVLKNNSKKTITLSEKDYFFPSTVAASLSKRTIKPNGRGYLFIVYWKTDADNFLKMGVKK